MVKNMTQRYTVAAVAFALAAAWTGAGVSRALECLLVFVVANLAMARYQRRQTATRRVQRSRSHRPSARPRRERDELPVPRTQRVRPAVYDADDQSDVGAWPALAERW